MKCPNCGEEMAENSLYCEHCGEDIHIVPDFEPELEQTIHDILEELHEDMGDDPKEDEEEDTEEDGQKPVRRKRIWPRVLLTIMVLALAAAGCVMWYAYGYYSEEYQLNRAAQYVEMGKYDEAIACYNRALELDGSNVELLFELADIYLKKSNKVEYEYLLREIVKSGNASSEQLDGAYGKLIAIYRDRKDYQTINALLLASGNEALIAMYPNYIAQMPEFSVNEGYYTSIQALKLTAAGSGRIYYTTDGSEPTEESTQYTAPIILENGDYVISAYFVNDNGIVSDVVTKEYHIENNEILPPEVSVISGEYYFPIDIEITSEDEDVYYTMDGSDPTYSSSPYTGPIHMPLGKSKFKFARIVDGVTGTIAERSYQLIMNTEITPEMAVNSVVEYCLASGRIIDLAGRLDGSEDCYLYIYQYVTNINKVDDFYVIAEYYQTADGKSTRTGTDFAVNAYTGERFKLQRDDRGRLSLIELDVDEQQYAEH
ncbi:MAG: tetratricopeptide repeat protein [Lachnospiraceae bacterium]|uniref:chitobiase/beta-hexosaminidase C-terminal domain-containing protein n=1 Tax=uncultured Acetatifactor sp. TaxID=1671927 RepID=UPI00262DABB2|nr:chitobiase/beta-hexosaminidase C-terminal domain-containing protein [uncultured Acetatifactor sp.]MCI8788162.1 tetratricopeptide repeat protein [Lachnospiraceae bacterium]